MRAVLAPPPVGRQATDSERLPNWPPAQMSPEVALLVLGAILSPSPAPGAWCPMPAARLPGSLSDLVSPVALSDSLFLLIPGP